MIPVSKPSLGTEEIELVKEVFDSSWLGSGAQVIEFEKKLESFLCSQHVVAVNTGTSALHLSLEVAGVKPGDEVIVPSLTFCASIQAIIMCGARPVFCEVSPSDLCANPDNMEKLITSKTRAIVPVHYGGIAAQMDKILDMAKTHKIAVVEDAAHAFGSSFKGSKIGSFGHFTCFSFDPIKNITCGEGGAISTNDEVKANLLRKKIVLGIDRESRSVITNGYRYHMSNINAAIGLAQLKKLESFRASKVKIVNRYTEAFSEIDGISILAWNPMDTFPFICTIRIQGHNRDDLMQFLAKRGINTSINYIPNHLQPFFKNGQKLPVTEQLFSEIITLPLFVDITDDQVQFVIESVAEFFKRSNR